MLYQVFQVKKYVESYDPGIEIYDKKGNKLLYKKQELPDEKDLFGKNL